MRLDEASHLIELIVCLTLKTNLDKRKMSSKKSTLCINFIAFLIFSTVIAPIESNELTKGVSDFAAEFYEVIKVKNTKKFN